VGVPGRFTVASHFQLSTILRAISFSNWLAALPNKLLPPPFRLIQMGSAYWQSRALYTATRFAIADTLGDDEKSSNELADELTLNEDHLYRLLRMLTSLGVFEECGHRRFRNNKLSTHLLTFQEDAIPEITVRFVVLINDHRTVPDLDTIAPLDDRIFPGFAHRVTY
jgi:hypothetical protein